MEHQIINRTQLKTTTTKRKEKKTIKTKIIITTITEERVFKKPTKKTQTTHTLVFRKEGGKANKKIMM